MQCNAMLWYGMYVCMYLYVWIYVHVCVYIYIYTQYCIHALFVYIYIYICMCLYIRIYLLIQWINVWHTNIKVLHQPHSYLHKPQHVPSNPTHLRGAQPLGPAKELQTPHPPGEIRAEAPGKWNLKWLRWKKNIFATKKEYLWTLGKSLQCWATSNICICWADLASIFFTFEDQKMMGLWPDVQRRTFSCIVAVIDHLGRRSNHKTTGHWLYLMII